MKAVKDIAFLNGSRRRQLSLLSLLSVLCLAFLTSSLPVQDQLEVLNTEEASTSFDDFSPNGKFIGVSQEIDNQTFFEENKNEEEEEDDVYSELHAIGPNYSRHSEQKDAKDSEVAFYPNHDKLFVLYHSWKSFLA